MCPQPRVVANVSLTGSGYDPVHQKEISMRNFSRLSAALVLSACLLAVPAFPAYGAGAAPAAVPRPLHIEFDNIPTLTFPPTTAYCLANFGLHCYQPFQLEKAYNLKPLRDAGIDGRGRTIVIVDSFGSPTIEHDLHVFDQTFGLPDPPSLTIIQPAGPVPPFDPTNSDMTGWAAETTLDVEWAHVFAPGAAILLVETPVSETEGVQGFPEIVKAENYVIDHDLGDVISQSFGATEETFPSKDSLLDLRSAFKNAAEHKVTVLGASGDLGATDFELNLIDIYPMRVNSWPSSDPLVTSVGGTMLTLDDSGNRLAPDVVWNDFVSVGGGAGGGGVSAVFHRPEFQDRVKQVVGSHRGTPDISMSASCDGFVVFYYTFIPGREGYHLVCGTSEASPEFAGIVAMADQAAGRRLGQLGPRLYELSKHSLVDVTRGNNTFGPFTNSDGNTYTVIGYDAGPGYDLASGLGTVDAAKFVRALAEGDGGDD
jgi:subtilase family serine protease